MTDRVIKNEPTIIGLLILATALGPLAMSSFIPAIPAIQAAFSVTSGTAQLTMSLSMVAMAVSSLIYGSMADRFGRRPVLLTGITLAVAGSLLCNLAGDISWVILGRALQAAGATSGLILTRVIVRDIYGDSRTASVLGYITAAMMLAPILGPAFGGILIEQVGWRSVFLVTGLFAIVLWFFLYTGLPETLREKVQTRSLLINYPVMIELLRVAEFRRYLTFAALLQAMFMAFLAGAPHLLVSHFGLPISHYGLYILMVPIGYGAGGLLAGRLGSRVSAKTLIWIGAWGSLLSGLLAFIALFSAIAESPWSLFAPALLMAFFQSLCLPSVQARLLAIADTQSGSASGLSSFTQLIIGALAAQAVGTLIHSGPVVVVTTMVVSALFAVMVLAYKNSVCLRRGIVQQVLFLNQ